MRLLIVPGALVVWAFLLYGTAAAGYAPAALAHIANVILIVAIILTAAIMAVVLTGRGPNDPRT